MSNSALSWRRVRALCVKETGQIVRDPSSWLIAVVIPLLLLILMFSLESRLVFLVLWIVSLIVICGYLICVEYIHDKMHRQLEINGMTVEDLAKSIKEEKER